jgi:hypothetical protein
MTKQRICQTLVTQLTTAPKMRELISIGTHGGGVRAHHTLVNPVEEEVQQAANRVLRALGRTRRARGLVGATIMAGVSILRASWQEGRTFGRGLSSNAFHLTGQSRTRE